MLRSRVCSLFSCRLANSKLFLKSSSAVPPLARRACHDSVSPSFLAASQGYGNSFLFPRSYMSSSTASMAGPGVGLLNAVNDRHGGVIVTMEQYMDSMIFSSLLNSSLLQWKQQGKKGIWIKLPLKLANLVDPAVKAGFRYHHAEPDYLMLVQWISDTDDTIPANASHRVAIGAFVMNSNREVLVVQESNGRFSGIGMWKLPTGAVNEGEDISTAAIREVKEETGIDSEFVEVLAFRQSHQAFFQKSDLFFLCMLHPHSFNIRRQPSEIAAAQWMPVDDYAAQPFVRDNKFFNFVTRICLAKLDGNYTGFTPLPTVTSSGKKTYMYSNNGNGGHFINSKI